MDIVGLVVQAALLVACIVAAFVLFIVFLMLGMAAAGDGSPPTTAKERWESRLIVVGAILVAIVIVGLLIAAFGILWNVVGLGMAVIVAAFCVVVFLRLAK